MDNAQVEAVARLAELSAEAMGGHWSVDSRAMSIMTDHLHGGKVFDIRGWGHFTGKGAMGLSDDEGEAAQRATGELVCALVNAYRSGALVPAIGPSEYERGFQAAKEAAGEVCWSYLKRAEDLGFEAHNRNPSPPEVHAWGSAAVMIGSAISNMEPVK